jgi:hypothetical protein
MYYTNHRKTRNKKEDKQLVKGIIILFALALCAVLLILGGILS